MEELCLALLESHLSGFEQTVNRHAFQGEKHLKSMMQDITLVKIKSKSAYSKKIAKDWSRVDFSSKKATGILY